MLLPLLAVLALDTVDARVNCYTLAPGLTIPGADFRREYALSRAQCAKMCKGSSCCLAFEWLRLGGRCTLKSASLNGTVTKQLKSTQGGGPTRPEEGAPPEEDVHFALCLDYEDPDRDRLWEHELAGTVVASKKAVDREQCAQMCAAENAKRMAATKHGLRQHHHIFDAFHKRQNKTPKKLAVAYSWRPAQNSQPPQEEALFGQCQCVAVLHQVRLSFGSFAGFLI